MAKANVRTETVTQRSVNLQLSDDEAKVLHTILRSVGGDPEGPRRHSAAIISALNEADVKSDRRLKNTGHIYLVDKDPASYLYDSRAWETRLDDLGRLFRDAPKPPTHSNPFFRER